MLLPYIDVPLNPKYEWYVEIKFILIMNIKLAHLIILKYFKIENFSYSKKMSRNSQRKALNCPNPVVK